jgi:S-adenosylmethionine/arginine decarboxylase-like enzyme
VESHPGGCSCIDLYDCDPKIIRDAEAIKEFVVKLCDLIKMKRFGKTQVIHFGEDERVAGYSMTQLIETSLISAHFANQTNTTYLDVFSCKAATLSSCRVCEKFFKAKR